MDDPAIPDTGNGTPPIVDMGAFEFQRHAIPTLPQWGRVALTLGLLTVGCIIFRRRRVDSSLPEPGRPGQCGLRALGALLGALAWTSVASAQVDVGDQIRIDDDIGTDAAVETSIASSNFNPNEIVAAWIDFRGSPPNPNASNQITRIHAAISMDGGDNWADYEIRPPEEYRQRLEGDPMTAYDDRTGTLWVGGLVRDLSEPFMRGFFVARKLPGENEFEDAVMVDEGTDSVDKGWMAAGPAPGNPNATNLYIAYQKKVNGDKLSFVVTSTDMGVAGSWGLPVQLGPALGNKGHLPRVGPNGELYVAYWDVGFGVLLKRSFDCGQTFGPAITIATRVDASLRLNHTPGTFPVAALSYLAVDQNNGTLYCVYFDANPVECQGGANCNLDLYFTKSVDQGASWTPAVVISTDKNPGGDQFFPWIEVDQWGNLHMVFYDSSTTIQDDGVIHGMLDAYYSFSGDGGTTWQESCLTESPFDSYDDAQGLPDDTQWLADYIGLGRGGSRIYPCYPSTQNGDPDIFTNVITLVEGACCHAGSCDWITDADCTTLGGIFLGSGSSCTRPDCNSNAVNDQCDIAVGYSGDCNLDTIPDECYPPQAETLNGSISAKNRYLSIKAGTPGYSQAIRVSVKALPPAFNTWKKMKFFVGQPQEACENSGQDLDVPAADCSTFAGPTRTFWTAPLKCDVNDAHVMDWHGQCACGVCVGGLEPGAVCSVDDDCQKVIHLYHEAIVPSVADAYGVITDPAVYDIQVVDTACSLLEDGDYSDPLTMIQARWGDVCGPDAGGACAGVPDGVVDVPNDVLGVLDKFGNVNDLQKARADLEPGDDGTNNGPDFKVNVANDVLYTLDAVTGVQYPFIPGNPCDPG